MLMYNTTDFENHLCQGDIIIDLKLKLIADFEPKEYFKGILILTYTCDLVLEQDPVEYINFCPIFSLDCMIKPMIDIYAEKFRDKKSPDKEISVVIKRKLKDICNYKRKNIFFLIADEILDNEDCYADLEQIYSITIDNVESILNNRKASLQSPWIEKLGFKIGYCFNRIALPDTPPNHIKNIFDSKYLMIIQDKTEKEST